MVGGVGLPFGHAIHQSLDDTGLSAHWVFLEAITRGRIEALEVSVWVLAQVVPDVDIEPRLQVPPPTPSSPKLPAHQNRLTVESRLLWRALVYPGQLT